MPIRTLPYIWVKEGIKRREVPAAEIITAEERECAEQTRASDQPSGGLVGKVRALGKEWELLSGATCFFHDRLRPDPTLEPAF